MSQIQIVCLSILSPIAFFFWLCFVIEAPEPWDRIAAYAVLVPAGVALILGACGVFG